MANLSVYEPVAGDEKILVATKGAVGELAVCIDLLKRGFEVFRNVSQSGSCDLIAYDADGRIVRIEATTGRRYGTFNTLYYTKHNPTSHRWDVIAVRCGIDVYYFDDKGQPTTPEEMATGCTKLMRPVPVAQPVVFNRPEGHEVTIIKGNIF